MHIDLEPSLLKSIRSNLFIQVGALSYPVYDIIYNEKIILKISEHLIPIFNTITLKGDNRKTTIKYYPHESDNILTDILELHKTLIPPEDFQNNVFVKAENFLLPNKSFLTTTYKLKLLFGSTKKKYLINKFIFTELEKIKLVAQDGKKTIKVNLNFFPVQDNFNDIEALRMSIRVAD